jgi:hypothetical protein
MTKLLELLLKESTIETSVEPRVEPRACVTPGCPHMVTEPWDGTGLLCYQCAVESELYDREARWDHVCPIPGTQCLPCAERVEAKGRKLSEKARTRIAR